jgi:hypothetical protein
MAAAREEQEEVIGRRDRAQVEAKRGEHECRHALRATRPCNEVNCFFGASDTPRRTISQKFARSLTPTYCRRLICNHNTGHALAATLPGTNPRSTPWRGR